MVMVKETGTLLKSILASQVLTMDGPYFSIKLILNSLVTDDMSIQTTTKIKF